MEKIIIFGAGNYGKLAFEQYGEDRVLCFVDNNPSKSGSTYCGKEIIDFSRYLEIRKDYITVIATKHFSSIEEQLKNSGIVNYDIFFPEYEKAKVSLREQLKYVEGTVVLLGLDKSIEFILKALWEYNIPREDVRIAEKANNANIGKNAYGYEVESLESISETDNIIISAYSRAAALDVYARRIMPQNCNLINPFIQKEYYSSEKLIHSIYGEDSQEWSEDQWNESMKYNMEISMLDEYVSELMISRPLFEHVEIETINRCNGICDFCPVNVRNDKRVKTIMDEALFKKIIDELSEINYSGRLATFSNNEPFLDSRIIDFNKYAREKLPNARMHLFTNGTLLTLDKFVQIVKYLDELIIDNYNQELKLIPNCEKIREYCEEHADLKKKVTIVIRKPHEILTSRGGDAPNRQNMPSYPDVKCALPFKQLIIRPDGKVSLCCNDPYGKYTLGDVSKDSLLDVWQGKHFEEVREKLSKGRKYLGNCQHCDTFIVF